MANLTITASSVAKASEALVNRDYNAGTTVTAGQVVYLSAVGTWLLAQCDGTDIESGLAVTMGIALHGSLSGQPLAVQVSGTITIGSTVVVGTEYVVSATAGAIAPHADLVTTNKYTRLAYAITTGVLQIDIKATGLAIP